MTVRGTLALVMLTACARTPAPAPSSTTAPTSSVAVLPAPSASTSAAPAIPPALLALVEEDERLGDPTNLYWLLAPPAPTGFRPIPKNANGEFPGKPYVEVRGYATRFSRFVDGEACVGVAPDGRMCPAVRAPGVVLSKEQAARLLRVAAKPEATRSSGEHTRVGRVHMRCGFDPHHVFVFLDDKGLPVGEVQVCFTCGEWLERPQLLDVAGMWQDEREVFHGLCEELGLGGCDIGSRESEERWQTYREWASKEGRAALLARQLGRDTGVDGAKRLADTTALERRKLCAWYARAAAEAMPPLQRSLSGQPTIQCDGGPRQTVEDLGGCVARFPTCSAPVSEAVECLRTTLASELCPARRCATECLFGLRAGN